MFPSGNTKEYPQLMQNYKKMIILKSKLEINSFFQETTKTFTLFTFVVLSKNNRKIYLHRIYTVYKMTFFYEIYVFHKFIEDVIINIFSFKATF